MNIVFVSADKRGFKISKTYNTDMGYKLYNVSSEERLDWIKKIWIRWYNLYGWWNYDHIIMKSFYSISTSNSSENAKNQVI